MVKQIEVTYNGVKYSRNALVGTELNYLGLRLIPKVVGLGSVIGCVVGNKFVQGENLFSYYQCIQSVFDAEDWKWLVDELIYNLETPLHINGTALITREQVEEHFAGDFVKLYAVTMQLAYKNLGELKGLTENMSGLAKNIANSLKTIMDTHLTDLQQSLNIYETNQKRNKKNGK